MSIKTIFTGLVSLALVFGCSTNPVEPDKKSFTQQIAELDSFKNTASARCAGASYRYSLGETIKFTTDNLIDIGEELLENWNGDGKLRLSLGLEKKTELAKQLELNKTQINVLLDKYDNCMKTEMEDFYKVKNNYKEVVSEKKQEKDVKENPKTVKQNPNALIVNSGDLVAIKHGSNYSIVNIEVIKKTEDEYNCEAQYAWRSRANVDSELEKTGSGSLFERKMNLAKAGHIAGFNESTYLLIDQLKIEFSCRDDKSVYIYKTPNVQVGIIQNKNIDSFAFQ
ncbi:hypothetical protein QUN95_004670 [Vibrio parahaemolyticus]|nr:hypothetical protein [Vibrio parahaemolyticus]EKM6953986.1 hypothetical protein [Vibrio parahaemolyticus]ELA9354886.1 hypothetical protein [Vibrio parahaemolyticus]ELA9591518.1 hypothetical protein [Vibrio parahaemolyticus]